MNHTRHSLNALGTKLKSEFPLHNDICYLNHAAVSPWPKRTQLAVSSFAEENAIFGATNYLEWLKTESALRAHLAKLINAPSPSDIALSKSTSEALSIIAYGLQWEQGDEIVISNQEFPSNRIVWESLSNKGVNLKVVNIDKDDPVSAIEKRLTSKTKLVSISSVQYASGLKIDIDRLGKVCKQKNVLFCVDAIQSLGAYKFDIAQSLADFVVADGHKWMMGPEGLALLYVKPEVRDSMTLNQYGWHMVKHRGDYTRNSWELAPDATRFECGSPNMLGIHALNASLSLINEIGIETISEALDSNISYLIGKLKDIPGIEFVSSIEHPRLAGIVTFTVNGIEPNELYSELMKAGVICACRGGGVRFSPHFYTPEHVIDRAIEIVKTTVCQLQNQ
ncbi:aminotransferase class V-fold PLP-dependent enzyme [Alkalimarinus coralli]|uniref:aminotransferase class V-fold PLP-dependent enzyme n=1 Tax=Alkalimarinus coralli TaxID=2935863 RepID=UPI00202B6D96|nr:aminotransferase class V-fold PLP-dependent enzyme [Alkalimarinus coralli]